MPMIAVNDINMHYEIHGEGEPLVLIAGLATDVTAYERLIAALSQRYRVIAFDDRGVGRTDKPDIPYTIDMMAEDTAGLLSALGIGPAHVLGVSMGGRIAVALALRHPELVKSLILVSTFVKRIPTTWRRRLIGVWLTLPLLRTLGDKYPQPRYAALHQRDASRNYDATDRLHEIGVPTLILHGRKDRVALYQLAEEMHAGIQGSQMIAFDGGHLFLFFRQQQFVDGVCAFLDSQTARPTQNG
jgi:3-oxoadipate enol-lactonase